MWHFSVVGTLFGLSHFFFWADAVRNTLCRTANLFAPERSSSGLVRGTGWDVCAWDWCVALRHSQGGRPWLIGIQGMVSTLSSAHRCPNPLTCRSGRFPVMATVNGKFCSNFTNIATIALHSHLGHSSAARYTPPPPHCVVQNRQGSPGADRKTNAIR